MGCVRFYIILCRCHFGVYNHGNDVLQSVFLPGRKFSFSVWIVRSNVQKLRGYGAFVTYKELGIKVTKWNIKPEYCWDCRYCNSHLQQLGQAPMNSKAAKARERKPSSAASKVCVSRMSIVLKKNNHCFRVWNGRWFLVLAFFLVILYASFRRQVTRLIEFILRVRDANLRQ